MGMPRMMINIDARRILIVGPVKGEIKTRVYRSTERRILFLSYLFITKYQFYFGGSIPAKESYVEQLEP